MERADAIHPSQHTCRRMGGSRLYLLSPPVIQRAPAVVQNPGAASPTPAPARSEGELHPVGRGLVAAAGGGSGERLQGSNWQLPQPRLDEAAGMAVLRFGKRAQYLLLLLWGKRRQHSPQPPTAGERSPA